MGTQMQEQMAAEKAAKEAQANTPVLVSVEITPKQWNLIKDAALDGLPENEDVADATRDALDMVDLAVSESPAARTVPLPGTE
jgi:hypothetical protein